MGPNWISTINSQNEFCSSKQQTLFLESHSSSSVPNRLAYSKILKNVINSNELAKECVFEQKIISPKSIRVATSIAGKIP